MTATDPAANNAPPPAPSVAGDSRAISVFSSAENFTAGQRMARAMSESSLVPEAYRGNLPNVLIALELASRIGASALMVMQSLDIVHGRPSWRASFLIATVNASGKFSPLRYRWQGTEGKDDWGCRAYARDKESGEECLGPLITIALAKGEGWVQRKGSKWQTLPELMLCYRAAAFFCRLFCPELSLGIRTAEEAIDTEGFTVVDAPRANGTTKELEAALRGPAKAPDAPTPQVAKPDAPAPAETKADAKPLATVPAASTERCHYCHEPAGPLAVEFEAPGGKSRSNIQRARRSGAARDPPTGDNRERTEMIIKINRSTGIVLWSGEAESLKAAIQIAVSARADLARADLARADLARAYLAGADLAGANLADANLARANLADANLAGADLAGAYLAGADLADANLAGADLARANLADANLADANLADANLAGAYLAGADLAGADLARANLADANLAGANLAGADLAGAYLAGANLARADLADANLAGADLAGANLADANLAGANLAGANLADANLARANLADANLARAYLADANLADANLARANLAGANLADANMAPAILDPSAPAPERREWKRMTREERMLDYRARHPEVPVIEHIDRRILDASDGGKRLTMHTWHCDTGHCRAGWATTLGGAEGAALEAKYGPQRAGSMIYRASTGRVPHFFASDADALEDIKRCAAEDDAAAQPSDPDEGP